MHRDISENNIITDPEKADNFTGMLIDLDLAIENGKRTGGRQMTGTMEFMVSMYFEESSIPTGMVWARFSTCYCGGAWEKEFQCGTRDRPRRNNLRRWYGTNAADFADTKLWNIRTDGV